jgi:hypothetical protein
VTLPINLSCSDSVNVPPAPVNPVNFREVPANRPSAAAATAGNDEQLRDVQRGPEGSGIQITTDSAGKPLEVTTSRGRPQSAPATAVTNSISRRNRKRKRLSGVAQPAQEPPRRVDGDQSSPVDQPTAPKRRRTPREYSCVFEDFREYNVYPKIHAYQHHVPAIFSEKAIVNSRLTTAQICALKWLASQIVGNPDLNSLFLYVSSLSRGIGNMSINKSHDVAMRDVCRALDLVPPHTFTTAPYNSVAILIH